MEARRKFWSKGLVIESIVALDAAGAPLSCGKLLSSPKLARETLRLVTGRNTTGRALLTVGRKKFGSWNAALKAAGLNPSQVRHIHFWRCDSVVSAIKSLSAGNISLNCASLSRDKSAKTKQIIQRSCGIRTTGQSLYLAGIKCFGSWDKALAVARIDPKSVRRDSFWTKEKIRRGIRGLASVGVSLNSSKVLRNTSRESAEVLRKVVGRLATASSLYQAARAQFGSWDCALTESNLILASVRRDHRFWTKSLITSALEDLTANKIPVNCARISRDSSLRTKKILKQATGRSINGRCLYEAGLREFGSWDAALKTLEVGPIILLHIRHRKFNLPVIPHQVETERLADGTRRRVTYLGTPPKMPDEELEEMKLSEHLVSAIDLLPEKDQNIARRLFEVILDATEVDFQKNVIQQLVEILDEEVSEGTIRRIFSSLASDPLLRAHMANLS